MLPINQIKDCGILPDESGFAIMSFPLPKDHWIYGGNSYDAPPMGMRMGTDHPSRQEFATKIKDAARYAVRSSTMKGKDMDFDPDALVRNMIIGLLGYHTPNGLSSDDWANPQEIPPTFIVE